MKIGLQLTPEEIELVYQFMTYFEQDHEEEIPRPLATRIFEARERARAFSPDKESPNHE